MLNQTLLQAQYRSRSLGLYRAILRAGRKKLRYTDLDYFHGMVKSEFRRYGKLKGLGVAHKQLRVGSVRPLVQGSKFPLVDISQANREADTLFFDREIQK